MTFLINLLIYSISFSYLFTAVVNFFHPITTVVSIFIIFVSLLLSVISSVASPLDLFELTSNNKRLPKILIIILLLFSCVWFLVVIHRPTPDTDAHIYHLPLSVLMNRSVWYPGIVNLNSHFGFANGNSVLASLFTSFKIMGLENIPNWLIWLLFGMGIFLYLIKKGVSTYISLAISLLFLFTPVIFWQSYNMGTDLPCACFLTFALLALYDKKFYDAALFFALSATFKTLGLIAFCLFILYILIIYFFKREKINLFHTKSILSFALFTIFLLRMFIASGNPLYPAFSLRLAPWGISPGDQEGLSGALKQFSGIKRDLAGLVIYIKDFFFFPKRFYSSYWFSPFFITCSFSSLYLCLKRRIFRNINLHFLYIIFLIFILLVIWFIGSPLVRFILGILIFINLKLFIFSYSSRLPKIFFIIIYGSLFITLLVFMYNVVLHVKKDVIPLYNVSAEALEDYMFHDRKVTPVLKEEEGFIYSKAPSNFCGRAYPPCINRYGFGDEDSLIKEYRKYNKRFLK